METWLDSLSEDWNSQPHSSSPKSLPHGTPSSSVRRQADGPCQKELIDTQLDDRRGDSPKKQTSTVSHRQVLTERSNSENNILQHSSTRQDLSSSIQHRFPRKEASKMSSQVHRMSRSSTISSPGSVIKDGTMNRKSLSSSPPKQRQSYGTPDWKKLVLGEEMGLASRKDLFSPIGLEGIFHKPPQGSVRKSPGALSFWQDIDSMPSSPPPWSSNRNSCYKSLKQAASQRNKSALGVVSEQEENNHGLAETLEGEQEEEASDPNEQSHDEDEMEDAKLSHTERRQVEAETVSRLPVDGSDELPPQNEETNVLVLPTLPRIGAQEMEEPRSEGSSAYPKSSGSAAFSPVFISKRNTIDGKVDYIPLDLSNPHIVDQLTRLSTQGSAANAHSSDHHLNGEGLSTLSRPSSSPSKDVLANSDVPGIGEFVSVERGGRSDYDSFKRKPLSPWESCSVGPSDSISQVCARQGPGPITEHYGVNRQLDPSYSPLRPEIWPSRSSSIAGVKDVDRNCLEKEEEFTGACYAGSMLDRQAHVVVNIAESTDTMVHQAPTVINPNSDCGTVQTSKSCRSDVVPASNDGKIHGDIIALSTQSQPQSLTNSDEQIISKRPASIVMGQSSPKRQRTLCQAELATLSEHVSEVVVTQHRRLHAVATILEDSVSIQDQEVARSVALPNVVQLVPFPRLEETDDAALRPGKSPFETSDEEIDTVQERIQRIAVPREPTEAAQIKAVAMEVATFRLKSVARLKGSVRKQSVSTKDYVDEAMKIMDLIRSKRRPQSIMSSLNGHESEGLDSEGHDSEDSPDWDFDNVGPISPQTVSRPPSRDGALNAWRTRNGQSLDPRVLSQLRKYQETGDESFLTSAFQEEEDDDMELHADDALSEPGFESDLANVRISRLIGTESHRRVDGTSTLAKPDGETRSPVKTSSSSGSTSSTHQTVSSQTTRTVPLIEAKSFPLPEIAAGMRFDPERHLWVRHVQPEAAAHDIRCDSEDPFDDITDLSVNDDDHRSTQGLETHSHSAPQQSGEDDPEASDIVPGEGHDELLTAIRSPSVRRKQQLLSVAFSSPPTFHEHAPMYRWKDGSELSTVQDELEDSLSDESEFPQIVSKPRVSSIAFSKSTSRSGQRQPSLHNQLLDRRMAAVRMEEHREVSLVQTRPDGRTMSLTLSISTPLPTRYSSHGQIIPVSAKLNQQAFHSLSPLSDFTLHQNDNHHLQAQNLLPAETFYATDSDNHKSAHTVSSLIEKLADAEPDEPYWDWMHILDLGHKRLDSLYTLNEFCPRIEQLDVSNNNLSHLDGAPFTIRQLHAQRNQLTGLTNWGHLGNLQYLNVSGNQLESLDGFTKLVHLRELRADDNRIASIKGILDLDGLLSLSLRSNRFESLDFSDADLGKLTNLDVGNNTLKKIRGLEFLPMLTCLDISNNSFQSFPLLEDLSAKVINLETLRCAGNQLNHLDVSLVPRLQVLFADRNELGTVTGICGHEKLHTVYLREQATHSAPELLSNVNDFCELRNLYLSGNSLPSLPIETPFLNLQTLEVAFAGVQGLPGNFGELTPNLRKLNLNSNSLKDLRPLRGIVKLKQLHVADNRLSRLRKAISVVEKFSFLETLDLRNNPLSVGFYAASSGTHAQTQTEDSEFVVGQLHHLLSDAPSDKDDQHLIRLDEDTKLRRRVFELLLGTKCTRLSSVDGLTFDVETALKKDGVWKRLLELGVVESIDTNQG